MIYQLYSHIISFFKVKPIEIMDIFPLTNCCSQLAREISAVHLAASSGSPPASPVAVLSPTGHMTLLGQNYNVGPPSDVCWFISPSKYSYKYHEA